MLKMIYVSLGRIYLTSLNDMLALAYGLMKQIISQIFSSADILLLSIDLCLNY
jgi:hypothetical protein